MSVSLTDPIYFTEQVFLRIPIEIRIKDLTELEATVANQNASAVNTTITLNETAVDDFMPSEEVIENFWAISEQNKDW